MFSSSSTFDLGTQSRPHDGGDLAGVGVTPQRGFGVDQFAVEGDLETALGGRQQLDRLDDRRPSREQFVRQTDGTRYVVSGDAELDGEAVSGVEHRCSLRALLEVAHTELVAFGV